MKGKRILVITSQVAGVGDIILSIPFFRALRESLLSAHLTLMVNPHTIGIVKGSPYFNEIIVYNKRDSLKEKWQFIKSLRERKFNSVVCLSECFSSLLIAYLSGAEEKAGFNWKGRGAFLTIRVPYEKPERKHVVEIFAELAQAVGLERYYKNDLELWISEREKGKIKNLFEKERVGDKDIKVVIHPGAGWEEKRWPVERFAQIVDRLVKTYEARVFIIGGNSDVQLANEMIELMKMKAINCVGRFDIKESAALMEAADLFIGNDSAPVHIAAAVHTPLIAIFGPTNMRKTKPLGNNSIMVRKDIECNPCFHKVYPARCPKGEPVCMRMITADDVWQVVKTLLNENNQGIE